MKIQTVFERYELKYLITRQQKKWILQAMDPYMALDRYGKTTIRNLYFDTDNFRLVRHSMEHPAYKEKLRIRSYRPAGPEDPVFIELKKKYHSVVYKRRLSLSAIQAGEWVCRGVRPLIDTQIAREIDYFCSYYQTLHPAVFLSYEREAYYSRSRDDLRITFDHNILARREALSLDGEIWGEPLLEEGMALMEIKTAGAIPLWMVEILSTHHIFKTSFSKYGTAYQRMIYEDARNCGSYADVSDKYFETDRKRNLTA